MTGDSPLTVSLTNDEALVLFEWLATEDEKGRFGSIHPAERKVLWTVEGQLERALVEPLQPGYADALAAARDRVMRDGT
jgi:hypothetical protein